MGRKLAYSYGEGTEIVRRVQLGLLGWFVGPEGRILADGLDRGETLSAQGIAPLGQQPPSSLSAWLKEPLNGLSRTFLMACSRAPLRVV